jgi:hypothetical protein
VVYKYLFLQVRKTELRLGRRRLSLNWEQGLFLEGFVEIFVGPSDIGTRFSETTSHLQADSSTTDANLIRWQRLAVRQLRERKWEVDSRKERHNFGVKTSVCKCWAGITTI